MAGLEAHGSPSEEEFIVPWLGCTGIIGGLVTIAPNFRVGLALPLPYQRRRSRRFTGRRVRDLAPSEIHAAGANLYLRQQGLDTSTTAGPQPTAYLA
jgi:hypothetical protein